jgi:hypothetical protein
VQSREAALRLLQLLECKGLAAVVLDLAARTAEHAVPAQARRTG